MLELSHSFIQGLGAISCFGDEVATLASAVESKIPAPKTEKTLTYAKEEIAINIHKVPKFKLLAELPISVERRLGNLSRICFQAILKAMEKTDFRITNPKRVGLVIGSARGATEVIEKYAERIAVDKGSSASPLLFANSVHNSISSFISLSLGIHGPSTTVVNQELSLASAIERANSWINEDLVDHVLVAVGDEIHKKVLHSYCYEGYQNIESFNPLVKTNPVMGEGAIGLVLSKTRSFKGQQAIKAWNQSSAEGFVPKKNIVLDAKGNGQALDYARKIIVDCQVASYATQYGSMTTGGALDLAIGSFALRNGTFLSSTAQHPEIKTVDENFETDSVQFVQVSDQGCLGVVEIATN